MEWSTVCSKNMAKTRQKLPPFGSKKPTYNGTSSYRRGVAAIGTLELFFSLICFWRVCSTNIGETNAEWVIGSLWRQTRSKQIWGRKEFFKASKPMLESALFRFAWRFCECWMKSGSCRIEILEKLWRKYWTQGREDSGIRFWHPESVSLMSPAFVKLGSPCALSWWLRFGTVLTSCCNLFVSRFSGYWKELPSGGAWSVGSIGLLLWGVVWLLGNLRNIVHIPQMKLKISENLIIWKFQWRSQISLHLCFWNKMCDVSHCFCMFFFHLKGRWCWSHPRWSWRVSEWTSLVDPRLETSWEVWSHRGE